MSQASQQSEIFFRMAHQLSKPLPQQTPQRQTRPQQLNSQLLPQAPTSSPPRQPSVSSMDSRSPQQLTSPELWQSPASPLSLAAHLLSAHPLFRHLQEQIQLQLMPQQPLSQSPV